MARPCRNSTGFFVHEAAPIYAASAPAVNRHLEIPLATTLDLLCVAATRSSRVGGFAAGDEPLDAGGRDDAGRFRLEPRFRDRVFRGSGRAAGETAAALGVEATVAPALDDVGHGAWSGRSFADVHRDDPDALAAWLAVPLAGTPGGEPMAAVLVRVGAWLDGIAACDRATCAITHPMVIRAALAHALALPLRATLAIDLAPLSRVRLSFHGQWRLQALVPRG